MATRYIDLRKLLYIDYRIYSKNTGNAEKIAKDLRISRSTFFEYKACLQDEFSAEIEYKPYSNTYVYIKAPKPVSIIKFVDDNIIEEIYNLYKQKNKKNLK